MNRTEFRRFWEAGFVILDGATGSNLQKAGMPTGVCPEQWVLENREAALQLQKAYVEAGTRILYAPTFAANRIKLAGYGLESELVRMNRELVQLSKEAADGKALVAGDMTMTGEQLYPIGDLEFEELIDIYKEQAQALADAGADLFVVETMMSLQETRAAVLAIREVCDLPIMASLTFEASGRTLFGTTPEAAVTVLQGLGADVVGMNCSTGPDGMLPNLQKMLSYASVPVLAKPNAGLPQVVNGETVYAVSPEEFAQTAKQLAEAGARFMGGCCGTTPEHIRRLADVLKDLEPIPVPEQAPCALASEREILEIPSDGSAVILGDQIDTEENDELREALLDGDMDELSDLAMDQIDEDAEVLNLRVAAEGIDEKACMTEALGELLQVTNCPFCFESADPSVVDAALRANPGRGLVNLTHMNEDEIRAILPVSEKYGALTVAAAGSGGSPVCPVTTLKNGETLEICR